MATTATKYPTSLEAYIANIVYGVFIQDDDDVYHRVYEKNWSKDVVEINNGTPQTYTTFLAFLDQARTTYTNRQLMSQSAVVVPADSSGKAGQVAHTTHFTAEEDGKGVKGVIVSVLKIGWVDGAGPDGGHREVLTEDFVLSVKDE